MIARQPLPFVADAFPHLHEDPATVPSTVDPFTITSATGFLPLRKPLTQLPDIFKPLVDLLDAMPVARADGSAGLVANFKLGHMIDDVAALPNLTEEVVKIADGSDNDGRPNLELVTALFRDYSFLASAYLMEPCWQRWSQNHDDGYGLGRDVLPACIAGPMVKCADVYVLFLSLPLSCVTLGPHMSRIYSVPPILGRCLHTWTLSFPYAYIVQA